jgi:hypothetical protein
MSAHAAKALGHGGTVTRLLWDLVKAPNPSSLSWVGMLPALSLFFGDKGLDLGWLMAGSMAIASLMSLTGERVKQREYRVLPVNDRDLWVTQWIYATCLGPALLLVLKCVLMATAAFGGRTLFTLDTLLLSTLYDVVYAGALLTVPLWFEMESKALALRSGRPVFQSSWTLTIFAFTVAMAAPFVLAGSLPKHVDEFTIVGSVALGLGLMIAVAALVWTPSSGGVLITVPAPAPATPAQPTTPDTGRSLKGIPVVLWSHARSTFVTGLLVMMLAAAITPFLPARPAPQRMVTGLFILFALMAAGMANAWALWVRRLKVLPLSARQINALFVLTPLLTWAVLWVAMLLVHVVLKWPLTVELGPAAIVMYAGLTALTHAIVCPLNGIVLGQTTASMLVVVFAPGSAIMLAEYPDIPPRLFLLTVAALSFAAAATINHFTLTRSTSSARAYRPFGVSVKP